MSGTTLSLRPDEHSWIVETRIYPGRSCFGRVLQAANALDGAEWGHVADLGSFPPSPDIRRTLKAWEGRLRGKGQLQNRYGTSSKEANAHQGSFADRD